MTKKESIYPVIYCQLFKQFKPLYRLHLQTWLKETLLNPILFTKNKMLHLGKTLGVILVLLHYFLLICFSPKHSMFFANTKISVFSGSLLASGLFLFHLQTKVGSELRGIWEWLQNGWQEAHFQSKRQFSTQFFLQPLYTHILSP